jgi:hypothetical protein
MLFFLAKLHSPVATGTKDRISNIKNEARIREESTRTR